VNDDNGKYASHSTPERAIERERGRRENFNLSLPASSLVVDAREKNVKPNSDSKTHHSFCQMILEYKN
jgi:hypothetical protein